MQAYSGERAPADVARSLLSQFGRPAGGAVSAPTGALALLAQAHQLARGKGLDFEERGLLPMDEGIVLVEGGEIETGLRLLHDAAHFLEQRQAKRELARACFLLAKAHLRVDDQARALEELRRAMGLAGFWRAIFLFRPDVEANLYFPFPAGISEQLWDLYERYDNRVPGVRSVQVEIDLKKARELATYSLRVQNDGGLQIVDVR